MRRVALFAVLAACAGAAVMAAAYQVHFSLNSAHAYLSFASEERLPYLMPVFWIGFNLAMFPVSGVVKRRGPVSVMAVAGALGGPEGRRRLGRDARRCAR